MLPTGGRKVERFDDPAAKADEQSESRARARCVSVANRRKDSSEYRCGLLQAACVDEERRRGVTGSRNGVRAVASGKYGPDARPPVDGGLGIVANTPVAGEKALDEVGVDEGTPFWMRLPELVDSELGAHRFVDSRVATRGAPGGKRQSQGKR